MKYTAAASIALLATANAFAPAPAAGRVSVAREAIADKIFGMDLWEPVKNSNEYGARSKKNVKVGSLGANSYVPAGLTKEQYAKVRAEEAKKKADNYNRNVAKAGVYEDFTAWYAQRGTELGQSWKKKVTLGRKFVRRMIGYSKLILSF